MEADEHKKWFKEPLPPSLKSSRGRSRGGGQTPEDWAGPEKGKLRGLLCGLYCPPGPIIGRDAGHIQTDGRGLQWRPLATRRLSTSRQNSPARSGRCSAPARNGAAENRASPLYIGRREEPRRSCAPPCSRFPPPPPLAHAREAAQSKGEEHLSAGAFPIGRQKR